MNARKLMLLAVILLAQISLGQHQINLGGGLQGEGFLGGDSSIKGSKYYFNDWGMGRIMFTDGNATNNGLLQVDLELDQLLVSNGPDKTKAVIVEIDKVEKFTINEFKNNEISPISVTFVKKEPKDFDSQVKSARYYKQLTSKSDYVLEEITKYLFDNSRDNTASFDKKSYKEYRIRNAFHIKDAHGKYQKFNSLNERAFSKTYPNLKKQIKEFVKSRNIDFDQASQLDSLVEFCLEGTKE